MDNKLLSFLEKYLGSAKKYSGDEYYYKCPLCNNTDNKKKLAIKLDLNSKDANGNSIYMHWHCWRDNSHKGTNLFQLIKKMRLPQNVFLELKSIISGRTDIKNYNETIQNIQKVDKVYNKIPALPEEFKSLLEISNNPHYKNAYRYITKNRNLTMDDIIKYNIGYCDSGKYGGYIIIPSYNADMNLNYFVARSFYESDFKYKNPPFKKDVIFNELYINWKKPIILCEGIFDAMAIRRNAIPILGVYIQPTLKLKLLREKVTDIYIALDKDAFKNSIKIIQELLKNYINVYHVEMTEKDPGELGFKKSWQQIKKAKQIKFEDLIKFKLNI